MQVKILDPKGVVWQGMSKEVVLPTAEGEISVLDFHQPFLIRLKKGKIRGVGDRVQGLAIQMKDGIAFMRSNELNVFVER